MSLWQTKIIILAHDLVLFSASRGKSAKKEIGRPRNSHGGDRFLNLSVMLVKGLVRCQLSYAGRSLHACFKHRIIHSSSISPAASFVAAKTQNLSSKLLRPKLITHELRENLTQNS